MRQPKKVLLRQAFTLIELMVVIGILALLISILLPSLNAAREFGRRTKCAANLHNLGLALQHYANDNEGKMPKTAPSTLKWRQVGRYDEQDDLLDPSLNQGNLRPLYMLIRQDYSVPAQFICPSTADSPMNVDDVRAFYDFRRRHNISYSYQNSWDWAPKLTDSLNLAVIGDRNPLIKFEYRPLGTQNESSDFGKVNDAVDPQQCVSPTVPESANSPNHGGAGQNILFVGGNVKWFSTPKAGGNIDGVVDNVYTKHDGSEWGAPMTEDIFKQGPFDRRDSMLVP